MLILIWIILSIKDMRMQDTMVLMEVKIPLYVIRLIGQSLINICMTNTEIVNMLIFLKYLVNIYFVQTIMVPMALQNVDTLKKAS